jgi:hypothetical protein
LFFLWQGLRLGVPRVVFARMVFNALIDTVVGAIPVVGDLFDFGWKANAWNLALLERHAIPGRRATSADWLVVILCSLAVLTVALVPILMLTWLGYSVGRLFAQ